ncbi:tyrosine-type recombinase/integrase [Bradyrhizobium sp. JYMT SZCCT0428]|uniref:tyrosine-type recombinase/integrase n=1 Tax=Bradyrhizobium sp. JYMT SZCCT0428 TaxID=2807673 RepID=UPI001BADE7A6|nr:tyrosine-type recombinase/integrase [Bradyrhizobium sp. JYMT SZCCT0428]MBR1152975.1 tyrosine-type recombinase/integrase [Bradyrhizobium sp. JYMT SZCCT0428]
MVVLVAKLKRTTTGAYVARKVIPKDIRSDYAARYGMAWEEKFYLGHPASQHEAKARFGEWLADIEMRIGKLRASRQQAPEPLTRQNAYALAGVWYAWFIARQEKDICTPGHWNALANSLMWDIIRPHAPEEYENRPEDDPHWDWQYDVEVRAAIRPTIATDAQTRTFLIEHGKSLTPDANNLFIDAVAGSLYSAFVRLENIARGNYASDGTLAWFPQYERPAEPGHRLGVKALFEAWAKAVQPATSTIDRWSAVFNAADEHFPDAADIEFAGAKPWMNGLITEERSAHTVATVWKTALKTLFAWGMAEKLVKSNPFRDVRISVPRKNVERETKAFSQDEAKVILAAALTCNDRKSFDERARRWVPWICAYSGARAGEITQLRGIDILQRGNDYFARLTPSAGKIKTRNARTIPLHEHLVSQGFLEFVDRAKGGPLFYDVERMTASPPGKKRPRQSAAERTRGRLGAWVRSLGITDLELSPNHAWRHTFKAQAARIGMDERYSDAITGHTPPTTGRTYTKPIPEDLAEAIRKFPPYSVG